MQQAHLVPALSIRTGSSINVLYKALRKTIVVGAIKKHQKFSYTWKLAGYPEIWIEIRKNPTEIVIVHCSISFGDDKSIKLDEFYFTNLLSSRPPFGEHHERRTQGRLACELHGIHEDRSSYRLVFQPHSLPDPMHIS